MPAADAVDDLVAEAAAGGPQALNLGRQAFDEALACLERYRASHDPDDAEALFLVRKFRLRLARRPVSLVSAGPSSVSLVRVAFPMLLSVSALRARWLAGGYREPWLALAASMAGALALLALVRDRRPPGTGK